MSPSLCSATRSRSTTRRPVWPKSSPCSTASPAVALVAGFPRWHADGRLLLLRRQPVALARQVLRGRRCDHAGLDPTERCSHTTAATTSSATSTSGRDPLQDPHPPVWIPGGGSVETWEWCADHNYVYCYLSYCGYKAGQKNVDGFWRTMQAAREAAQPVPRRVSLQLVAVGETEQEVADKFGPHAEYFYNKMLHIDPRYADPPVLTAPCAPSSRASLAVRVSSPSSVSPRSSMGEKTAEKMVESKANSEITWNDLIREGNIVAGTPSQVTETARGSHQDAPHWTLDDPQPVPARFRRNWPSRTSR